jgi:replicative superfamily II helicase
VAFHTADLDREERLAVEEHFRAPGSALRVIAATTTLAMGVNTPAEAVVIAGLMHPGDNPYSVAEYKNIVGRAGRLGFSEKGTSYLLATDPREEHTHWNQYVLGTPEDLGSRFVAEGTDPRTLILRVLAAARSTKVKGIPASEVIDFLEGSFGAFQKRLAADNWAWDRIELSAALSELEQHRLIETGEGGHYHLTPLGRFAGEAGVQVESVIRLVAALSPLSAGEITDQVLIAATQLTTELDDVLFPMNKKSTEKEPHTWFRALSAQGIPGSLQTSLRRYVREVHTGTMRAKKAAACLYWISPTPMADIERALTQHGGAFDGAAGPVRAVSARTCDLLPAVSRVARFLHPDLPLADRVARLLIRLELGAPAGAVAVARHAGARLSRSDYLDLVTAGLVSPDAIDAAPDDAVLACVGGDSEKLQVVRDAAAAIRNEPEEQPTPDLPAYEA